MNEGRGFAPPNEEVSCPLALAGAVAQVDHAFDENWSRSVNSGIAEIASLSTARIMEMPRGDLANLIRRVRTKHLRPGMFEQLPRMDEASLRRLAFATRRYCRDQALMLEGIIPDAAKVGHLPR